MKKDKLLLNTFVIIALFLLTFIIVSSVNVKPSATTTVLQTVSKVGLPIIKSPTDNEIVVHRYYSLSYNETHEQPNWVYYLLTYNNVHGNITRESAFVEDEAVSTKSSKSADYKNSGYDRGHICPAADMRINQIAMKESFYMSNICPQKHQFNAGVWLDLENYVRSLIVNENDTLYIVAGPVLKGSLKKIKGKYNEISVPNYFYKIIYSKKENWLKGFLIPHSANYKNKKELSFYSVTVDSLEKMTDIDFFPGINNEDSLESTIN